MRKSKKGFGLLFAVIIAVVFMTFLLAIFIHSTNGMSNLNNHISQMQASTQSKCAMRLVLQYIDNAEFDNINLKGITKEYILVCFSRTPNSADEADNNIELHVLKDKFEDITDTDIEAENGSNDNDITDNKDIETNKYLHEYIIPKSSAVTADNEVKAEGLRTLVKVVYNADMGELRLDAYSWHNEISEDTADKDSVLGDMGATNREFLMCKRNLSLSSGDDKNGENSPISRAKIDFTESSAEYNYVTVHVKPYKNADKRPYIFIWTNQSQNMTPWIRSSDSNMAGPTTAMEYVSDGWYEYTAKFLKKNNEKSFNAVIAYKGDSGFKRSNDIYALPIKSDDKDSNRNDVYITFNNDSFYSASASDGTSVQSYKQTVDKYFTSYTVNRDMYMTVNFKVAESNEEADQNCPYDFTYQGYGWYKRIILFNTPEEKKNYILQLEFNNNRKENIELSRYSSVNEIFVITREASGSPVMVFTSESEANRVLKYEWDNAYAEKYANVNLKLFNANENTDIEISFNPPVAEQSQNPDGGDGSSNNKVTFYFEAPSSWGNSPDVPPLVFIIDGDKASEGRTMTYVEDNIYKYTYEYPTGWVKSVVEFSNQQAKGRKLYKATDCSESENGRIYISQAHDGLLFKIKDYKPCDTNDPYGHYRGYLLKDGKRAIGSWYDWSNDGYKLYRTNGKLVYLGIVNIGDYNPSNTNVILSGDGESVSMYRFISDTNGFNYYVGCLPESCTNGTIEISANNNSFEVEFECDENQIILTFGEYDYEISTFGGLSESYVCSSNSLSSSVVYTKSYDVLHNDSQEDAQGNDGTESDFDSAISYSLNNTPMAADSGYKTQYYNVVSSNTGFTQDEIPGSRSGASASAPLYDWYVYKVPIKYKEYNVSFTIVNRIDGVKRTYTIPAIERLTDDVYITVNNYDSSTLTGDSVSLYMMNPDENDVKQTVYFDNVNGWGSPRIEYRSMNEKNTKDSSLTANKSDNVLFFTLPDNCVGFRFYDAESEKSTEQCNLRYGTLYDNNGKSGVNAGREYLTVKEQLRIKTDEALATLNNCCIFNKTVRNKITYNVEYENKLNYKSNTESSGVYFMQKLIQTVESAQNLYKGGCYSMTVYDSKGLQDTLNMINDLDKSMSELKKLYSVICEARLNLTEVFDDGGNNVYAQAYPEGNERPEGYRLSANSEYLVQKQHDNAVALYLDSKATDNDIRLAVNDLQNCLEYKQYSIENAIGLALINMAGWDISDDNVKLRIEYKDNETPIKYETLSIQNDYGGFNYILRDLNNLKNVSVIQFVYTKDGDTQTSATFDVNLRQRLPNESPERAAGTVWLFDNSSEEWIRSTVNDIYTVSTYEIKQENGKSFLISSDNNYESKLKIHFMHDTVVKFTKDTTNASSQSGANSAEKEYVIYSGFYNITDTHGDSIDLFSLAAMRYFSDYKSFEFSSGLNYTSGQLENSYDVGLTDAQGKLRDDTSLVTTDHSGKILNLLVGGTYEAHPGIDNTYVNTVKDAGVLNDNLALSADRINFRWVRGNNKFFTLNNSVRFTANIISLGIERINYGESARFTVESVSTAEKPVSYIVLMNDLVLHSTYSDSSDRVIKAGTYAFAGAIDLLSESNSLIFVSNETNAYNNKGKMRLTKRKDSNGYTIEGDEIYGN